MNSASTRSDVLTAAQSGARVLSASTLEGDHVFNLQGEKLGSIKEFMLDIENGKVRYVVMSFGGFLSVGEKLFAVPWDVLTVDVENKRFLMNVDKDRLKDAPGFDPEHWPNMADATFAERVNAYYGATF